jgi:hypothetical protein
MSELDDARKVALSLAGYKWRLSVAPSTGGVLADRGGVAVGWVSLMAGIVRQAELPSPGTTVRLGSPEGRWGGYHCDTCTSFSGYRTPEAAMAVLENLTIDHDHHLGLI